MAAPLGTRSRGAAACRPASSRRRGRSVNRRGARTGAEPDQVLARRLAVTLVAAQLAGDADVSSAAVAEVAEQIAQLDPGMVEVQAGAVTAAVATIAARAILELDGRAWFGRVALEMAAD